MGKWRNRATTNDDPTCVRLDALPLPAFVADASGRLCGWNPALLRLAGRRADQLAGARVTDLLGRDLVWAAAGGTAEPLDVTVTGPDGRARSVRAHPSGLDGDAIGRTLVVLVEPATAAGPAPGELRAPRIVQWSEITDRLRSLGPSAVCATFGIVGLDAVNASYSRSTGDHVLTQVAARLAELAPDGAVIERTGGERFVVVVPEHAVPEGGWADMVVRLRAPVDTPLGRVAVGSSVGIAAGDPRSGLVLLDASERRLDSALQRGAGIVEEQRTVDRALGPSAKYSGDLVDAVAAGGVRAHFQPVFDLLSSRVVEFEALARWDGDDDTRREAAEFISAAADTGVLVSMGDGVLHDATELARSVAATIGDRPFAVSVNVSIRELLDVDFLGKIDEHLRRAAICPANLQLEVVAAVPLEEIRDVADRITALRRLGVRVALDNVGGPDSSVIVLRDLAVDVIKLDPSIVAELGVNRRAEHLLRSLLELGRRLGVAVVAKGVERDDQHELLRSLGCRYAQGYLYGAATPALDLPFDQLVGPGLVGPPLVELSHRAAERSTVVTQMIGHGAFDHAGLDDLTVEAANVAGASTAVVGVVESDHYWIASAAGCPDDRADRVRELCAEVIRTDLPVVVDDEVPNPESTEAVVGGWIAVPIRWRGTVTVAVLCVARADRAPIGDGGHDSVLDHVLEVADHLAVRLEVRARLAGARIEPQRPVVTTDTPDELLVG